MRALMVAYEYPWPANSGVRLPLLTSLHALCSDGPTEFFSITPDELTDIDEPDRSSRLENLGRDLVTENGSGCAYGPSFTEPDLRQRCVDGAYQHPQEAFEQDVVEGQFASVAEATVTVGPWTAL